MVVVRDRDIWRGIDADKVVRSRRGEREGRAGVGMRDGSSRGRCQSGGGVVVRCGVAGRDGGAGGVLRGWGLIAQRVRRVSVGGSTRRRANWLQEAPDSLGTRRGSQSGKAPGQNVERSKKSNVVEESHQLCPLPARGNR